MGARRKRKFGPTGRAADRPFGTPDGANANLQSLLDNFVEFKDRGPDDALAAPAEDHSTRVVVGKMGVGKTVYLRRFQAAAHEDEALYTDSVRQDVPSTSRVIAACQELKSNVVEESWARIWRRAIVRAAIAHVLCAGRLCNRPEADVLREHM